MDTEECQGKEFKILDTAGEEDYQNMLDQWISLASGFILVFSIVDRETFKALEPKLRRIEKNDAIKLPIVLVGNKYDLKEERKVTIQQAEEFAKSINAKYYETSALNDENGNVKIVFQECANMILGYNSGKDDDNRKCFKCSIF